MKMTFNAIGLTFEATYDVTGKARRATQYEPAEDFEIEIESLYVDDQDVTCLLQSSVSDLIEEAAYIAAEEDQKAQYDDYLEGKAADRAFDFA
jgi:hypothetical protein